MDEKLKEFLRALDEFSQKERTIIAMGGNALVIMGTKEFTEDIDICIFTNDADVLQFADNYAIDNYVDIHVFVDGWIRPMYFPDMLARATPVESGFSRIRLYTMNIYDMILTKIDRWQEKDIRDVRTLAEKYSLLRSELTKRCTFVLKNYHNPRRISIFQANYKQFIGLFGSLLK